MRRYGELSSKAGSVLKGGKKWEKIWWREHAMVNKKSSHTNVGKRVRTMRVSQTKEGKGGRTAKNFGERADSFGFQGKSAGLEDNVG